MSENKCFLYIIAPSHQPRYCKIGITANPDARLKSLQTGSPLLLSAYLLVPFKSRAAAEWSERVMHVAMQEYGLCGEWFNVSPDTAIEVMVSVDALLVSQDFDPNDFLPLTQMIAHKTVEALQ